MAHRLVYSKHTPQQRCGVAFFAGRLAELLDARTVHGFHGFRRCDEFYINLDIWELEDEDIAHLEKYLRSGVVGKTILLMHDYRESYLEDRLVELADRIVNLSGEPSLNALAREKTISLFTPPLTRPPALKWQRSSDHPLSLSFGFFNARKKSFKTYLAFYEHMTSAFPEWRHIIVASAHEGQSNRDGESLQRILDHPSITVLDFVPNSLLSEMIHAADAGVCFYPTGIMANNTAPMSFFEQGRTVVTTRGSLTPEGYEAFILDGDHLGDINFSDISHLRSLGETARHHYEKNLSWDRFVEKLKAHVEAPL